MELSELQNLWQENERKMQESIRLNREILSRILRAKPEKRMTRMKVEAFVKLVLPLVIIATVLLPNLKFRNEPSFFIGASLFIICSCISYYWAIRYYRFVVRVDFSSSILEIRKQVAVIEKYKLRITKLGYLLVPFMLSGIFMLSGLHVYKVTFYTLIPFYLIVIVFVTSVYVTFKYGIGERFRKLNQEIADVEELMREGE